jgi:hypothetical protein
MTVRRAVVAGQFYPRDPHALNAQVDAYLRAPAKVEPEPSPDLWALVVPHAGYVYSGPTAGVGYRLLPPLADRLRRVVLLGPAHFVPLLGIEISASDGWATPLGQVSVDAAARAWLVERATPGPVPVTVADTAHAPEHCLEVQLPFLQATLPEVAVLPVLVGESKPDAVADLLTPWWGAADTLLLVSTDLSHYEPAWSAEQHDERTCTAIERADAEAIGDHDACGARPLRALLRLARRSNARVRRLDRRTSADTAGSPHRVVGYGAFAVEPA